MSRIIGLKSNKKKFHENAELNVFLLSKIFIFIYMFFSEPLFLGMCKRYSCSTCYQEQNSKKEMDGDIEFRFSYSYNHKVNAYKYK